MSRSVSRLARLQIPRGGPGRVHGNYAYVGHMTPPHGTTIIDVSDPRHPQVLSTLLLPDDRSHSHKVRVAGDLMVVNVEQNQRHLMRRISAALKAGASTAEFRPADVEAARRSYTDGGFRVY